MDDAYRTNGSASEPQPNGYSRPQNGANSSSRLDQASCLKAAHQICAFYRRDEAHDPEVFALALATVLGDFPPAVVAYLADPRSGVPKSFPMGLPNIGQIQQLAEDVERRQATMAKEPVQKRPRFYTRDTSAGARVNLFIGSDCGALYQEACEYAKTADPIDWRYGPNRDGLRQGIWVNLHWRGDRSNNHRMRA